MNKLLLPFLILIFSNLNAQVQKGTNIDGVNPRDFCGASVAINRDGNTMAMGCYFSPINGYDAGLVQVFDWIGNSWTQRGSNLLGDSIDDSFGYSIDLSSDGNILVVGIPYSYRNMSQSSNLPVGSIKVYNWSGSSWQQMGSPIIGDISNMHFGRQVSISKTGNTISVYSRNKLNPSNGKVNVYSWNGINWIQLGQTLSGENVFDGFGVSTSFNRDGSILAIGAPGNDGNGSNSGHCRVFQLVNNSWTRLGMDIDGEASNDYSGVVALNDSGNVVVIGASGNSGVALNAGHARVYKWDGMQWVKVGQDIDGEAAGDGFGSFVSINAVGDIVAIGAPMNAQNGPWTGHARISKWNGTSWVQVGSDIDGDGSYNELGPVKLDSLGYTLVVGAPGSTNSNGVVTGHSKVFDFRSLVFVSKLEKKLGLSLSPNPFNDKINFFSESTNRGRIEIFNMQGKLVYNIDFENPKSFNFYPEIPSGIYLLNVVFENGERESLKIVKN